MWVEWRVRACTMLLAAVAGTAGAFDATVDAAGAPPALVLTLRLTSTQPLPPTATATLKAETEAIWRAHHLRVRWISDDRGGRQDGALPVVVVSRAVPAATGAPWTIGELVRSEGAPGLVLASITGAQRIVSESGQGHLLEPQSIGERRLGAVLGRAIAHEIGHYLLQTNAHAHEGLMRARIDAREFADPRSGAFRLDKAAAAHVAALAASGQLPADSAVIGAFAYSTR